MNTDTLTVPESETTDVELPRRRFTLDDLDRMSEAGIFGRTEHVELIRGEIVKMQARGGRHENLRIHLSYLLTGQCPDDKMVAQELGWRPENDIYLEPDIIIVPKVRDISGSPASEVLLVIEVAASSLSYDLKVKAPLYASLGVRELWVIDADSLETTIHLEPRPEGYASYRKCRSDEKLTPTLMPELSLALYDLDLEPPAP